MISNSILCRKNYLSFIISILPTKLNSVAVIPNRTEVEFAGTEANIRILNKGYRSNDSL